MKSPTLVSSSFGLWLLFASSLCTFCFCIQNPNNILCIADERSVLFEFKRNLIDYNKRLSSWSGEDCCNWCGVVCDEATGNVLEIHLRGPDNGICSHSHESNEIHDKPGEAFKPMLGGIQSPSLINLKELRYLDLSYQNFISTEIPAFIGSFLDLKKLQDLDKHGIKLERAASNWQQIHLPHLSLTSTFCITQPNHQTSQQKKSKTDKDSIKASNTQKCPSDPVARVYATRFGPASPSGYQASPTAQQRQGFNNKRPRDEEQQPNKRSRTSYRYEDGSFRRYGA